MARGRCELAALGQQLHDDGRRGQREAQAEHHGGIHTIAPGIGDAANEECGDQHLSSPKTEDQSAHRPEPAQGEFQADGEEQKDDTEFGEWGHALDVADQSKAVRPDGDANGEIAQDRARAQTMKDRHDHHSGDQENEEIDHHEGRFGVHRATFRPNGGPVTNGAIKAGGATPAASVGEKLR